MPFEALSRLIPRLRGHAGIVIEDGSGATLFSHEPDALFPSASVIKVPLVMALYAEAASGRIDLGERVAVGERVDGSGILRHATDLASLTLRDLATLAIIVSDNTATNRVIERVGVDAVNAYLDRWGCPRSRLRRAMYDFAARDRGLENEMTPRESARLLGMLVRSELVDRATSGAVLAILAANQDEARFRRYLPEGVWAANKSGSIARVRNDIGVVRVDGTSVVAAGFCSDLASEREGEAFLGFVGWSAYRAAGGPGEEPTALV